FWAGAGATRRNILAIQLQFKGSVAVLKCKSCPQSDGGVSAKRHFTSWRKIPNAPCATLGSREGRFREPNIRCHRLHLRCRRQIVADPNTGRIAAFIAVRKRSDLKNCHARDPVSCSPVAPRVRSWHEAAEA